MSSTQNQPSEFLVCFDALMQHYIDSSDEQNMGLKSYFDSEWPSPCLALPSQDIKDGSIVNWSPYLRTHTSTEEGNLSNIEKALETNIPLELKVFFSRYYSHDINASAKQGKLTLLQAWNEEDFDRLQKNLIAHVLMKRRLKQAETMFFALTDEEDYVLSVLLSTGSVVLEKVGKEPEKEIAANMKDFIASLKPAPQLVEL